jgi:hypothetical protein
MFLCTEFEHRGNEGYEFDNFVIDEHIFVGDWFKESCDVCLRKIAKRWHSVRRPLLHGGWQGCYCSIKCVKEQANNSHVISMINKMEDQLINIGIRDR